MNRSFEDGYDFGFLGVFMTYGVLVAGGCRQGELLQQQKTIFQCNILGLLDSLLQVVDVLLQVK